MPCGAGDWAENRSLDRVTSTPATISDLSLANAGGAARMVPGFLPGTACTAKSRSSICAGSTWRYWMRSRASPSKVPSGEDGSMCRQEAADFFSRYARGDLTADAIDD